MANEFPSSFAEMFPRLFELTDISDLSHPDAFFHGFDERLTEPFTFLPHYQKLEGLLSALDDVALGDLRPRAAA